MNVGTEFHISHGNVKFEARKYIRLTNDKHEYEFQNEHYALTFTLEKGTDANWGELTNREYGKKLLRFTKRANGELGLWVVLRFTQDTVINKALEGEAIWRTVSVGGLTYSFTIAFNPSIVDQIKDRCDARTKQMIAKKQQQIADSKKPVEYICHNPRPYQGGSFSSK